MYIFLWLNFIFLLDAEHVLDCVSPSSGATFYKLYIAFGIFGYVSEYTKCDVVISLITEICASCWFMYKVRFSGLHFFLSILYIPTVRESWNGS